MSSNVASGVAERTVTRPAGTGDVPPLVPVICGPTASGKSDLGLYVAARRPVTIISADSRQIYRAFDIGTAKPTTDELRRVPHRGIDVVEPVERYSAAQWATLAESAIREAHQDGRLPLVVGGTGFYIRALFSPLFVEPELDAEARLALQQALATTRLEELRRWCRALDPARAHLGRAQLLRAIEVALLTGERLSALHASRARPRQFQPRYLLLDPGPSLAARIAARASAMFDRGWPEEVRTLMRTVPEHAPAWGATGYGIVRQYVRGDIGRDAALERVIIDTRQYAKRQRTWFRHQLSAESVMRVGPDQWRERENIVDRWITQVQAELQGDRRDGHAADAGSSR